MTNHLEEMMRQDLIKEHYLSDNSIFLTMELNVPINVSEYIIYHEEKRKKKETRKNVKFL